MKSSARVAIVVVELSLLMQLGATHLRHKDLVHDLVAEAEGITGGIATLEQMVAKQMHGHPKELAQEEGLLHLAAKKADISAKAIQHIDLIQRGMPKVPKKAEANVTNASPTTRITSRATLLGSMALVEGDLQQRGQSELRMLQQVKDKAVEALGEQDPRAAVKVEKLMDQVGNEEKVIMKSEAKSAESIDRSAFRTKERRGKLGFLARSHSRAEAGTERLVGMAAAEQELVHSGLKDEKLTRDIKGKVANELGKVDPKKAAKVEMLLDQLQGEESSIIGSEAKDVTMIEHLASNAKEHRTNKTHSSHKQTSHNMAMKVSVGALARLAVDGRRVASRDRQTLHSLKQLSGKVGKLLAHKHPGVAKRVERLLAAAQRMQRGMVETERQVARFDEKFAKQVRTHVHRMGHQRHRHGHARRLQLSKEVLREVERASLRERHAKKLVLTSKRVLKHMKEAHNVVVRELRGTRVGAMVDRLLSEAHHAARKATRESYGEVVLTRREVRELRRFSEEMQQ